MKLRAYEIGVGLEQSILLSCWYQLLTSGDGFGRCSSFLDKAVRESKEKRRKKKHGCVRTCVGSMGQML